MHIGIIGSGTMGAGIAQVAAKAGHKVIVIDSQEKALNKAKDSLAISMSKLVEKNKISSDSASALQNNITWSNDKQQLNNCGLIIEAIVEKLEVKKILFTELESIVSNSCILASNTSSLSLTSIAAACSNPERIIGIHFFNPAPIMELVEIIPALQTSENVTHQVIELITTWGKQTVLAKDTPGFIVNRIARPFYSEAIRIYEEGFADIADIDASVKKIGGFRMGPFELMDLIGHDINYAVTESVWTAFYFDSRYTPSFTQKRLVEANWLGKKSHRGFYNYTFPIENTEVSDETKAKQITQRIVIMLVNEAANALWLGVAKAHDIELAMTKGVNYPKGLLQWADEIGIDACIEQLDNLYHIYHEDRYRACPLLRKMAQTQQTFFTD